MKGLAALGTAVLFTVALIINGFVIMVLWGWYAVPLGLPSISIPHAIGIDLLATDIVGTSKSQPPDDGLWLWVIKKIATAIIYAFLILGIGWVLNLFM